MIHQFTCWRIGLFHKMYVVQVEKLLSRLRELDGGVLPTYLQRREQYEAFAGEAGIQLCENWNVQQQIKFSDAYPKLDWLAEKYTNFLEQTKRTNPELMVDPPQNKLIVKFHEGTPEDKIPDPTEPISFDTIVNGSVSNVVDRTEQLCSDQPQAISSLSSRLEGLQNYSRTAGKLFRPHLHLTPISGPRN